MERRVFFSSAVFSCAMGAMACSSDFWTTAPNNLPHDAEASRSDAISAQGSGGMRRLEHWDFDYEGAFRVPEGDSGTSTFDYGGGAMAFNPANQSLFIVGNEQHQKIAEIKIPDIRLPKSKGYLATATRIQTFADPTGGKLAAMSNVQSMPRFGGLIVQGNTLIGSAYVHYDTDTVQQKGSHFTTSTNLLDVSSFKGMHTVGTHGAGFVSGYMTNVPPAWQFVLGGPLLTGQCCIPILSRTSYGPSAFVFDPTDLGVTSPAPTVPLLYYTEDHQALGEWNAPKSSRWFNGTSMVSGMVFPSATRTLLYIGSHGTGPYCEGAECDDPARPGAGGHAYPYQHQVWAYDAEEFVKVRNGEKEPWDIEPYSAWDLPLTFQTKERQINGVAYDDATRRIFISGHLNDGSRPIIYVFKVK